MPADPNAGRRRPPAVPQLPSRPTLERLIVFAQDVRRFLQYLFDTVSGVPGGWKETDPNPTGTAADPGTEDAGWMAADATIKQGIVTTKGDILTHSTVPARLPIGVNDTVLLADSGQTTGQRWAPQSDLTGAGGGWARHFLMLREGAVQDKWPLLAPAGSTTAPSYSWAALSNAGLWITPNFQIWKGQDASGTDASAATNGRVDIRTGRGTGTGTGAEFHVYVSPAGAASSSTLNTEQEAITVQASDGRINIGGLDVQGAPGTSTWAGADRAAGVTDGSGGHVFIDAGKSTGAGVGGDFLFRVTPPGATGSAQNAQQTAISISSTSGGIGVGGLNIIGAPSETDFLGADRATGVTDGSGGLLVVAAGKGTGTGNGGTVQIKIAPPASGTGSSQNAYQNAIDIQGGDASLTLGGVDVFGTPGSTTLAGVDRAAGVTDGAGGNVTIRGGLGTGTGADGTVKIQLAPAASGTGTTQNAARDVELWDVGSLADPQTTDITLTGDNGGTMVRKCFSELLTLSTVGTTTDTSANLLPAGAIILAVNTRVTTTITTATTFSVGDPTTAARFSASAGGLTAGSTRVGLQHQQGSVATDAAGPVQTSAAKVRITTDVNPGAGVVRIQVWALVFGAPTS